MPGNPAPWAGNFTSCEGLHDHRRRFSGMPVSGMKDSWRNFSMIPRSGRSLSLGADSGCPLPPRCEALACDAPASGRTWNDLLARVATSHLLYFSRPGVRIDPRATDRLLGRGRGDRGGSRLCGLCRALRRNPPGTSRERLSDRKHPRRLRLRSADPDFDGRRPPGAAEIRGDPVLSMGGLVRPPPEAFNRSGILPSPGAPLHGDGGGPGRGGRRRKGGRGALCLRRSA